MIEAGEFDVCTIIFNRFRTVISQIATTQQLIPFAPPCTAGAIYEFEPSEEEILAELYRTTLLCRSTWHCWRTPRASRAGVTAIAHLTRNAGKLIDKLTLSLNRPRQTAVPRN
jgi:F-type H+-transporting ATPase subunit gamma